MNLVLDILIVIVATAVPIAAMLLGRRRVSRRASSFTDEMIDEALSLVDAGTIRVVDMLVLVTGDQRRGCDQAEGGFSARNHHTSATRSRS